MVTPKDFIKFEVTDRQWALAQTIGMARFNAKNRYKSTRNLSKINTHVCGAIAEIIFAQWQEFEVDDSIHPIDGDKYDFISRDGKTIDIKHSTFCGKDIELKEKVENVEKGKVSDIYVLCRAIIKDSRVTEVWIVGWIDKDRFLREENQREPYVPDHPKYPWNYVVGLDQLDPCKGGF
jgi:hypothetical protein